jgi:hypothetical protein
MYSTRFQVEGLRKNNEEAFRITGNPNSFVYRNIGTKLHDLTSQKAVNFISTNIRIHSGSGTGSTQPREDN